jgi:hypothetical protein
MLKKVCESMVVQMGGEPTKNRMLCDYVVFFLSTGIKVIQIPTKKSKDVNFRFITESYFNWIRLDESEFLVNRP